MGLTKEEFFALTPRLFLQLRAAWEDQFRDMQTLFALVRRDVINHSIFRPEEPVGLDKLLPPLQRAFPAVAPRRRMTRGRRQRVADQIRGFFEIR